MEGKCVSSKFVKVQELFDLAIERCDLKMQLENNHRREDLLIKLVEVEESISRLDNELHVERSLDGDRREDELDDEE